MTDSIQFGDAREEFAGARATTKSPENPAKEVSFEQSSGYGSQRQAVDTRMSQYFAAYKIA